MEQARSRGAPFALKEYTQMQRYGMGRQGRYIISSECQRERGAPCLACNFYVAEEEKVVEAEEKGEGGGGAGRLLFALAVLRAAGTEVSERRRSVRVRGSECYTIKRGGRRPSWCAASL